jgi:hypothetical protein
LECCGTSSKVRRRDLGKHASVHGSTDLLEYLSLGESDWSFEWIRLAIEHKQYRFVDYLIQRGCPYRNAILHNAETLATTIPSIEGKEMWQIRVRIPLARWLDGCLPKGTTDPAMFPQDFDAYYRSEIERKGIWAQDFTKQICASFLKASYLLARFYYEEPETSNVFDRLDEQIRYLPHITIEDLYGTVSLIDHCEHKVRGWIIFRNRIETCELEYPKIESEIDAKLEQKYIEHSRKFGVILR